MYGTIHHSRKLSAKYAFLCHDWRARASPKQIRPRLPRRRRAPPRTDTCATYDSLQRIGPRLAKGGEKGTGVMPKPPPHWNRRKSKGARPEAGQTNHYRHTTKGWAGRNESSVRSRQRAHCLTTAITAARETASREQQTCTERERAEHDHEHKRTVANRALRSPYYLGHAGCVIVPQRLNCPAACLPLRLNCWGTSQSVQKTTTAARE
jgi:hypothetical protein